MATKTECDVRLHIEPDDNYEPERVIVYKEGPLFVWQSPKGWTAGHFATGFGVSGNRIWDKKRDALAYVQRILEYEKDGKKIDWNIEFCGPDTKDKFMELNGRDFLQGAYDTCNLI